MPLAASKIRLVRRLALAGLAVVLLLAAGVAWVYFACYRNTLFQRYSQVRRGMDRIAVEAVLQSPPGDFRTVAINHPSVAAPESDFDKMLAWQTDDGAIYVFLDTSGAVVAKRFSGPPPRNRVEGAIQQYLLFPLDEQN